MTTGLTLAEIRGALAAQLRANIARDVTVREYRPGTSGPTIIIDAAADYLDYWLSFSGAGLAAVRFDLQVDPAGSDYESALRRLDDFLSAGVGNESSIIDAVMVDPSLGLANANAQIDGAAVNVEQATAVVSVVVRIKKES